MAGVRSHEDLVAWRLSDDLEDRVYEIADRPSARSDRDFCDDMRRAGRSAPANLSEAFHRYRPRDAARFARFALGSIGETINHLRHAHKRKYITKEEYDDWTALARRAHRASSAWLAYLESCPSDGPARTSRRSESRRTANAERDESLSAEPDEPDAEP